MPDNGTSNATSNDTDRDRNRYRLTRRTIIATQCGDAYAAVIERAAHLRFKLAAGHDPTCSHPEEARLVSVDHNRSVYRSAAHGLHLAEQAAEVGGPYSAEEAAEIERDLSGLSAALTQAEDRYEDALTLAALREAAELILTAPPLNNTPGIARNLTSLHISRMAIAIELDHTTGPAGN